MPNESGHMKLAPNSNFMQQTNFSVQPVGSSGVTVIYDTLPGNNPSQYSNTVMVWQNPNYIPWTQSPTSSATVPKTNTTPHGTVFVPFPLGVGQSFIVGFCAGSAVGNACSTVFLPAGGNPYACQAASLGIVVAQTNNLVLSYALPFGSTPETFSHWVGVWEGPMAPYSTQNIFAQGNVTSNGSSDIVNIPLTNPLKAKTMYTAAYFAGKGPGAMAVTCTFQTD